MKNFGWMTIVLLNLTALPAFADKIADVEEWSTYVREETPAQTPDKSRPTPVVRPDYPPEVAATLKEMGISLDPAPIGSAQPEVSVDKSTQTITIDASALDEPWVRKVSTGGGIKIPNPIDGSTPAPPYCAKTPTQERHFIPARTKGGFPLMETVHYSNTFTHDGQGSEMRWAIRTEDNPRQGVFFHEVPGGTVTFNTPTDGKVKVYNSHLIGHNVSGECVRLDPKTARLLYGLALKYGGIYAQINGDDPTPVKQGYCAVVEGRKKCFSPNYCDEEMRLAAANGVQKANEKIAQNGGGLGGWLTSIFGGGSSNSGGSTGSTSGSTTPAPSKKKGDASVADIINGQLGTAFSN